MIVVQALCAVGVIILMAIQTDKAEQSGVMGLGASGGRTAGEIDMNVGAERILKPLTKWMVGGFLASSILAAISADKMNIWYLLGGAALFAVLMLFGGPAWQTVTGMKKG